MKPTIYRRVAIHRKKKSQSTDTFPKKSTHQSWKIQIKPDHKLTLPKQKLFKLDLDTRIFDQHPKKSVQSGEGTPLSFSQSQKSPLHPQPESPFQNSAFPVGYGSFPVTLKLRKLGTKVTQTVKLQLIRQFFQQHLKNCTPTAKLMVFYDFKTETFFCVVTGNQVPVSRCCSATMVAKLPKHESGKLLCSDQHCYSRTVQNFIIPLQLQEVLWNNLSAPLYINYKEINQKIRTGSYKWSSFREYTQLKTMTQAQFRTIKKASVPIRQLPVRTRREVASFSKTIHTPKDTFPILTPIQKILNKQVSIPFKSKN